MNSVKELRMKIENIHNFQAQSEEEFLAIQKRLVSMIKLSNNFSTNQINLCAGVDLAYWESEDEQYGVCCIIVMDYKIKAVVEKVNAHGKITTPHIRQTINKK